MASKLLPVLVLLCVAELSLMITTVVSRDTPVPTATSKAVLQTGILQANSTIASSPTGIIGSRNQRNTKITIPIPRPWQWKPKLPPGFVKPPLTQTPAGVRNTPRGPPGGA